MMAFGSDARSSGGFGGFADPYRAPRSNFISAAHRCYWGYKIFNTARTMNGDCTKLIQPVTECFTALALEEAVWVAIEASHLAKHTSGFGAFSGKLSKSIGTYDRSSADDLGVAQRSYDSFVACDANGDGWISKEEFIAFAAMLGETRPEYVHQCFLWLDKDKNGYLSFEEWLALSDLDDGAPFLSADRLSRPKGRPSMFKAPRGGYPCRVCRRLTPEDGPMLGSREGNYYVCGNKHCLSSLSNALAAPAAAPIPVAAGPAAIPRVPTAPFAPPSFAAAPVPTKMSSGAMVSKPGHSVALHPQEFELH